MKHTTTTGGTTSLRQTFHSPSPLAVKYRNKAAVSVLICACL